MILDTFKNIKYKSLDLSKIQVGGGCEIWSNSIEVDFTNINLWSAPGIWSRGTLYGGLTTGIATNTHHKVQGSNIKTYFNDVGMSGEFDGISFDFYDSSKKFIVSSLVYAKLSPFFCSVPSGAVYYTINYDNRSLWDKYGSDYRRFANVRLEFS